MKLAWSVAVWCALGFTLWWSGARARDRVRAAPGTRTPRVRAPHPSSGPEARRPEPSPPPDPIPASVDVLMDD